MVELDLFIRKASTSNQKLKRKCRMKPLKIRKISNSQTGAGNVANARTTTLKVEKLALDARSQSHQKTLMENLNI